MSAYVHLIADDSKRISLNPDNHESTPITGRTTDDTDITDWGADSLPTVCGPRRAGLKAWPSLRVRCSGALVETIFTDEQSPWILRAGTIVYGSVRQAESLSQRTAVSFRSWSDLQLFGTFSLVEPPMGRWLQAAPGRALLFD